MVLGCQRLRVHYPRRSSIEMPGRKTLQTNQRVEFEFEQSERGLHATRVVPLPMKTEDAAS